MTDATDKILTALRDLEAEAEREFAEQRQKFHYTLEEKRVTFEAVIHQQHKRLRVGLFRFIRESGFFAVLAAVVVYAQIIPLALLDLAVTVFQFICFPVYGIAKVPRDDFIAVDRHHLAYLNMVEKLNCVFCGYANGLLAYAREIAGRTEAHFCPIKHARRTRGQHPRYYGFAAYGDAEGFRNGKKRD